MIPTPQVRRRRLVGYTVLALSLGILTVMVLATLLQTYLLAEEIRDSQQTNSQIIDTIKDCTQPKGDCYREGQRRTNSAVVAISEATSQAAVYAAYCVKQVSNESVAQIERCVNEQFKIARVDH